jgi:RimJ/RimL family protein N-acetyltransferase
VYGQGSDPAIVDYFWKVFDAELAEGKTYPQAGPMTRDEFAAYFFNSVTIVGVLHDSEVDAAQFPTIQDAMGGRSIEEALAGCYYIKPNYPGRSSHNCNAGFLVPPVQRGKKIGGALAESFLYYAPALGYRSSVFNLVYENNVASLRLWDKLGFQRVGLIPKAGLLKTGPNGAEEYVDAVVVYKSFV